MSHVSIEDGHIIGSNNHGCGQTSYNIEDAILYLGCHYVHLENQSKIEIERASRKYQLSDEL